MTMAHLPQAIQTKIMKQLLGLSLLSTILNLLLFGPKTTETMMERMDLEGLPGGKSSDNYKKANNKFMKYHGLSSIANLVSMCGAVGHASQLARAFV